jgi:hypothetical protein
MIEIYSNENFKIIQDNTIFKIIFTKPNKILINSIIKTKLITGTIATEDFKMIKFKANSVKTLKQYKTQMENDVYINKINNNFLSKIVESLSIQLNYLIKFENNTILGYNPESVFVINDCKFIFLNSLLLCEIKKEHILISHPFKYNDFFVSPELLKVNCLPTYIHYKTAYFSFALLILYLLISNDDFYIKYLKCENYHKKLLLDYLNKRPIINTKIYWLISRCLVEEPEKRSILFI